MAENDTEFLMSIVTKLVDHPENVSVTRVVDEMGVLLTLDLHPEDMGKVIGREGNTAKAIRTLLRVMGMKHGFRVNLKITEPEGSTRRSAHVGQASTGTITRVREERGAPPEHMRSIDEALQEMDR